MQKLFLFLTLLNKFDKDNDKGNKYIKSEKKRIVYVNVKKKDKLHIEEKFKKNIKYILLIASMIPTPGLEPGPL